MKASWIAIVPTLGYVRFREGMYLTIPAWLTSAGDRVIHHIVRDKEVSLQLQVRPSLTRYSRHTNSTVQPRILALIYNSSDTGFPARISYVSTTDNPRLSFPPGVLYIKLC